MQYIFIHGLGQNSSSWDKVVSFLPKSSSLLCPDLWALLANDEYTFSNLYRAFKDYCNAIPGPVNLCGLSLGAMLALSYAIEYPNKVQSIVLIGAQYKMPKGLLKFQNVIFRFTPKSAFAEMGILKNDFIKLTSSMTELDYSIKLRHISCDTLVVCGANDNANAKSAKVIAEAIPNAEIRLVESAGHEVNSDAPEKLADILNIFWKPCK